MALRGNTPQERAYNFLRDKGMSVIGVVATMGGIRAESGFKTTNLQNSYNTKLGITDEEYTKRVDSGKITRSEFISSKHGGYGYCQWTYHTRKAGLYDYAKESGKSIGDEEMQLGFLWVELSGNYKGVLSLLNAAKTVKEASDIFTTKFERPGDQSAKALKVREDYSQEYYDMFVAEKGNGGTSMEYSRQKVVDLAESWEGKKESDGSHKEIIDIYNTLPVAELPRRTKMLYTWAWCACTWSALAVKLGYTPVMPIEISCYYLIEAAKKMGMWVENDAYVPKPGDAVLYDWADKENYATTDNTGTPDHVGAVIEVYESAGYMVVMEGNYSNAVKRRTLSLNGKFIRGFITPKYTNNTVSAPKQEAGKSVETVAREVISGKWGSGTARKTALTNAGYDYATVQAKVNEILNGGAATTTNTTQSQTQTVTKKVTATCSAKKKDTSLKGTYTTTTALYLRNDAGKNKKALVVMPKNQEVKMYGYYNIFNGVKWYYVQTIIDGVQYTGFCSSDYLKKQ